MPGQMRVENNPGPTFPLLTNLRLIYSLSMMRTVFDVSIMHFLNPTK